MTAKCVLHAIAPKQQGITIPTIHCHLTSSKHDHLNARQRTQVLTFNEGDGCGVVGAEFRRRKTPPPQLPCPPLFLVISQRCRTLDTTNSVFSAIWYRGKELSRKTNELQRKVSHSIHSFVAPNMSKVEPTLAPSNVTKGEQAVR